MDGIWLRASAVYLHRIARERIGDSRILTTPGILVLAAETGVITVEELRDAKKVLERNRFRVPRGAWGELLSE